MARIATVVRRVIGLVLLMVVLLGVFHLVGRIQ